MALLLVRHANAGRRSAYKGDDRQRPLSPRGQERAIQLVPLLAQYRPQRILSSPYVRCWETVQPLAEALGLPVESVGELAEGHGANAVELMVRMAGESAVLCTHGDVATDVLAALGSKPGIGSSSVAKLQKGEVWVIQSAGTSLAVVEHHRKTTRTAGSK
jgi:8-oxo-(d)GTP phosphatase